MNTAGSLHLTRVAYGLAHKLNVVDGCAACAKSRTCLYECSAGCKAILTGARDLLVIQKAALKNDLNGNGSRSFNNGFYISYNVVVVAGNEVTAVNDHVNLGCLVCNGLLGFRHLCRR